MRSKQRDYKMIQNISIVLPIRNGQDYVQESLQNLMHVCEPTDEIIVIDDFSTDKTQEIVRRVSKIEPRVRLITNNIPGIVSALNLGILESSNRWIARVDVDDRYEVCRLDEQREMIGNKTVGIFSDYDFFSKTSPYLGSIASGVEANAVSVSLISGQRTAHSSVLFDKEAAISLGGYRQGDFPAEDLSLWMRMSRVGNLISIPKTLMHYRLSANSVTGSKRYAALAKKFELQRTLGINYDNILNLVENFDSVVESYKLTSKHKERELLLLRDLFEIYKINGSNFKLKARIRKILFKYGVHNVSQFSTSQTLKLLYDEKRARDKERNCR